MQQRWTFLSDELVGTRTLNFVTRHNVDRRTSGRMCSLILACLALQGLQAAFMVRQTPFRLEPCSRQPLYVTEDTFNISLEFILSGLELQQQLVSLTLSHRVTSPQAHCTGSALTREPSRSYEKPYQNVVKNVNLIGRCSHPRIRRIPLTASTITICVIAVRVVYNPRNS